jgi:lysophospholipase L1-like esterase
VAADSARPGGGPSVRSQAARGRRCAHEIDPNHEQDIGRQPDAGTNDIAGNTGPISLEEIEENYETMAELARAHGVRVTFSSILPVHNYTPGADLNFELRPPEKIVALNRWLERYCRANGLVYLDYFSAMVDEHGRMRRELADQGLHPKAAGYAVMMPLAARAIDQALAGAGAARHPPPR